jgi:hypothetical protein
MPIESKGRLLSSSLTEPRDDDLEDGEDIKDGMEEKEGEEEV